MTKTEHPSSLWTLIKYYIKKVPVVRFGKIQNCQSICIVWLYPIDLKMITTKLLTIYGGIQAPVDMFPQFLQAG